MPDPEPSPESPEPSPANGSPSSAIDRATLRAVRAVCEDLGIGLDSLGLRLVPGALRSPCICASKLSGDGYAIARRPGSAVAVRLSRLVLVAASGPIPEGCYCHHRCRVRACLRASHLVSVTPAEHYRIHRPEYLAGRALAVARRQAASPDGPINLDALDGLR